MEFQSFRVGSPRGKKSYMSIAHGLIECPSKKKKGKKFIFNCFKYKFLKKVFFFFFFFVNVCVDKSKKIYGIKNYKNNNNNKNINGVMFYSKQISLLSIVVFELEQIGKEWYSTITSNYSSLCLLVKCFPSFLYVCFTIKSGQT